MVTIRPESPEDISGVWHVNQRAFGRTNEADLVDHLRADSAWIPEMSFVAATDSAIAGHCLFTRASVEGSSDDHRILALGPIAVLPEYQRRGIGSSLIRHGLKGAGQRGFRGVILIGHPEYYPRFGFRPGDEHGLTGEFEVPREVFMALPLVPEGFSGVNGRILLASPFRNVE